MPRVCIITRTLDRPVLLRRTLRSLLAQTFSDWQWVIVTPEPKPGLLDLLDQHTAELAGRQKILTFESSAPGMRGQPLNHAISETDSDLITVLDDDDTWDPAFLQRMTAVLDSPAGGLAGGAVCQTEVIEESPVSEGLEEQRRYPLNPRLQSVNLGQLAVVNAFCIHAFLYRRSCLETSAPYPPDYPVLEDWFFNLQFLARHDIAVLPEILTYYHQRPAAVSAEANSLHAELDAHKFYESRLINDLLRRDMAAGRWGLGALLAQAAQTRLLQDRLHTVEGRLKVIGEKTGKIDARTRELKTARK
jgi:glycosyltransferase involved in cell wall biosynthesis